MRNLSRRSISGFRPRRLVLQRLEDRTVPANLVWVGDVNGQWGANSGGNTNWFNQTTLTDNVLPHNGDNLLFTTMSANHTQSNNLSNLVPNSISFSDTDYIIGGSPITVDTITDTSSAGGNILNFSIIGPITVSVNAASTRLTLGGVISGSGALTKSGSGILRLSGASANTYTGLTTVNAGTLELNKSGVVAVPGNLTINSGGTARELGNSQIGDTSTVTVGGAFDLNNFFDEIGPLTVIGGSVTAANPRLTAGPVAMTGGAIDATNSQLLLKGEVTINAASSSATIGCVLNLSSVTRTFTIADGSAISDLDLSEQVTNGAVTKAGPGTLRFSGSASNTYTGLTTVSDGTLQLNKSGGAAALAGNLTINFGGAARELAGNQIADTSTVTVNAAGTLDLNGQTDTVNVLSVRGGSVTAGAGTLGALALSMTSGSIASTGAGQLLLLGDANFDLSTSATISGTLNLGGATRTFFVPFFRLDIFAAVTNGGLTKTGGGGLNLGGSAVNTYTGSTTVSEGTLLLQKSGGATAVAGQLIISGGIALEQADNQIADASTVIVQSGGSLDVGSSNTNDAIGPLLVIGGSVTIGMGTLTAGPLDMTGGSITSAGTGKLVLQGNVTTTDASATAMISGILDLGGATRTFSVAEGTATIDLEISAQITGTGSAGLTKSGAGTLRLDGSASNTYPGATAVIGGTLELGKIGGTLAIPGNLALTVGAVRELVGNQIADNSAVLAGSSGPFDLNGQSDTVGALTLNFGSVTIGTGMLTAGPVTMTGGSITSTDAGRLVLQGNVTTNSVPLTASISGNLDLGGATRTFTVADGAADIDLELLGVVSGAGSAGLTKAGAGTLRFAGPSPNTYAEATTVLAGLLVLFKTGAGVAVPANLTINGGSVRELFVNQIADTSTVTVNEPGNFELNGLSDTIGSLAVSGISGGTTVNIGPGTLTAGSVIMTGGSIFATGTGMLVLQGDVTTSGAPAAATISGILDLGGAVRTFTIPDGAASPDLNISADIQNGGLNKAGSGTLQFSGSSSNTYADLTTVSGGTLQLNKSGGVVAVAGNLATVATGAVIRELSDNQIADTGFVTVNPVSTFHLNGQTDSIGVLTVNGTLNTSGATAGRLTVADTTFDAAAALFMRLVDANASDRINVNGTLTLGGALALNPTQALPIGTAITLIDKTSAGAVTGTFTNLPQGATIIAGGQTFSISYTGGTGNDVVVTRTGGPTVLSTRINDGSAQRSRVTSLTVTFSAQVTFAGSIANAFTLTRAGGGTVSFQANSALINAVTVVTLNNFTGSETEFGSLRDGRYTLTAIANQISLNGQQLDGNGDGLPGDNYTFGDAQGLFRYFGDSNGDRHIDIADFGLFSSTFGLHTGQAGFLTSLDFNNDGVIDIADFGQFAIRMFTVLP